VRPLLIAGGVLLLLSELATAQKVISPVPSPSVPLQQPSPSAREDIQAPQHKPGAPQQPATDEERGTEGHPDIVKILPPDKTAEERAQEEKDREDKASADWWLRVLTAALVIVGIMQFLALIGQAIVFVIQARQLRRSVELTGKIADRQERDMHASISEASRAAAAMEGVAAGINESGTNTRELFATQRQFAKLQLRPYLSVVEPGFVAQNTEHNLFAGIQINVLNTGHSPALNFRVAARVKILPFPLPEDFDFTIPRGEIIPSGHINPGQRFFVRRNLDRRMPDDEVRDIMAGEGRRLYIYGTIFFIDSFDDEHYTNFCQFAVWDVRGNFIGAMNTAIHNDAT
jgi:hypothetical protein